MSKMTLDLHSGNVFTFMLTRLMTSTYLFRDPLIHTRIFMVFYVFVYIVYYYFIYQLFVEGLVSYLCYLCLCINSGVHHILCCVFLCLSSPCITYIASISGLSILYCLFGFLSRLIFSPFILFSYVIVFL